MDYTFYGEKGRVNTILARKEEPVDSKVAAVLEKYRILFNVPEQLPLTRAIARLIKLFDEAAFPPKLRLYRLTQEELEAVKDNIDLYL